jgi:hypothetical protein
VNTQGTTTSRFFDLEFVLSAISLGDFEDPVGFKDRVRHIRLGFTKGNITTREQYTFASLFGDLELGEQ